MILCGEGKDYFQIMGKTEKEVVLEVEEVGLRLKLLYFSSESQHIILANSLTSPKV